mmetsp:Transcript_19420/g.28628  ORF Transcript_19420/g.28628 Transcript_19420/m.28628 type:complete len:549 (-) Transcript_19420:54-1700(-)
MNSENNEALDTGQDEHDSCIMGLARTSLLAPPHTVQEDESSAPNSSSSSSSEYEGLVNKDCLICLSKLQDYDIEFPLLCPRSKACTNLCYNCLSILKNDPNRPSTSIGSMNIKTCPKCKGDVSKTINDTYYMRSVRRLEEYLVDNIPDSELSGAELRLKCSISPNDIASAETRLEAFRINIESRLTSPSKIEEENYKKYKDLTSGMGKSQYITSGLSSIIDVTLLAGLEHYMSKEEQAYITELLTSGDTSKLAQAAQILSEIKRLNDSSTESISNNNKNNHHNISSISSSSLTAASSFLAKGKKKLKGAEERAMRMMNSPSISISTTTLTLQEQARHRLQQNLPPMPKFVTLKPDFDVYAAHRKVLKFKDDGWDGSVADGYARAYTMSSFTQEQKQKQPHSTVSSFQQSHARFRPNNDDKSSSSEDDESVSVVSSNSESDDSRSTIYEKSYEEDRDVETPTSNDGEGHNRNRVLVAAARRQAYNVGIREGDCVTHVNMEEFHGTSDELKSLINTFYLLGDGDFTFNLVLNAERSTAEVLKQRRAIDFI